MSASSTVSGPVAGPVTVKPEGTTVSGAGNGADDDDDEQDRPVVVDGPSQHPQDSCGCTTDTNSNSKTTCEQLLRQQKCEKVSAHYQRKFRSVVPLRSSSLEFRHLFTTSSSSPPSSSPSNQHAAPIWVDVRTAAERAVSIIAGAVTLSEWEADEAHDSAHQQLLQESPVIVYCTIGYRSGMEARRLQQRYPHLRIYNLDGIIAYSHVVCAADTNNNDHISSPSPSVPWQLPPIVHPETGDAATHIHTFGKAWDFVNQRQYSSVHFGTVGTVAHMMRVGQRAMGCHVQTLLHHCGCCRRSRHLESGNGFSHRKEKVRIE